MARCECPFEKDTDGNTPEKFTSSRQVVLHQLSSSNSSRRKRKFKAYTQECRFDLVRSIFLESGAVDVDFQSPWVLAWTDGVMPQECFPRIKPYQKMNHFPGMGEICKKDLLSLNLKRMKGIFPKEYNFFPTTFRLPYECRQLSKYCQNNRNKFFIIKPDRSCQGDGIEIVKGVFDAKKYTNVVCQKYIIKPLLMDGYKMDVRLYVLVTSVIPLRVYLYKEGLVRLATVPYKTPRKSNLSEKRMHLTNYAINRNSSSAEHLEANPERCKRCLSDLEELLISQGLEVNHLWTNVDSLIIKTLLSTLPTLQHVFHSSFPIVPATSPCFELLGFDILLNESAKPYLLEVNRSPSLGGSSPIDKRMKGEMVRNVIEMVLPTHKQITLIDNEQHLKARRRLVDPNLAKQPTAKERVVAEYQLKREISKMGNFRQIYPAEDGRYDFILKSVLPGFKRMKLKKTADVSESSNHEDSDNNYP